MRNIPIDLKDDPPKKKEIALRVQDWIDRIDALYALIREVLAGHENISICTSHSVFMHEELMQKCNLPSVKLPALDIKKNNQIVVTAKPVGLWVIGANGRVDLLSEKGSYILVAQAAHGTKPNWQVFSPSNREKSVKFDRAFIKKMVN